MSAGSGSCLILWASRFGAQATARPRHPYAEPIPLVTECSPSPQIDEPSDQVAEEHAAQPADQATSELPEEDSQVDWTDDQDEESAMREIKVLKDVSDLCDDG